MDKKKKKYIVLTIIAVLLIGLLILINVIGAGTKSASADSIANDVETGITNTAGLGVLETPTGAEFFFGSKKDVSFCRAILQFEPLTPNKKYSYKLSIIGKGKVPSGNNAFSTAFSNIQSGPVSDISIRTISFNNSITEINGSFTSESAIQYFFVSFYNFETKILYDNEYWVNILNFEIYDDTEFYYVNYQSYMYDYLKSQFENTEQNGYQDGYNNGLNQAQYGIFANAKVEKAYMEDSGKNLNGSLKFITGGISLENYALAAEPEGDPNAFIVIIDVTNFEWKNDLLFNPISTGVEITLVTDTGKRIKTTLDTNNKEMYGYPVQATYTGIISKIEIWNANFESYGKIFNPNQSIYNNGYNNGYNEGYDNGKVSGQAAGRIEGYNQGEKEGYQKGYSEGLAQGEGPLQTIPKLFSTINEALKVPLIGEISLQDLLNIMICVTFVVIALKLFAGG